MRNHNYVKIVRITLSVILFIFLTIAFFIYKIDPNQIYHKHDTFTGNQRYEIAGIAKNHDYNAAILGTSMCMNHYPEQIDSLWGWTTKNFTMMGATHDEYDVLIPFLLSRGKLKNIIFGLDLFSFISELGAIPKELYDDNLWNDISYLLSYEGLKQSINYILNPLPEKDIYHFNSPAGKEIVIKDFIAVKDKKPKIYNFERNSESFDKEVFQHISNSPLDIKWFVYFPPVNIGEFSLMYYQNQLEDALKLKSYIIERLVLLPNVEVYDFQREPWITDLNEYMDLHHHSHKYNRLIIESIHKGLFRVNKDSINYYNDKLREMAKEYIDTLTFLDKNSFK